MSDLPSAARDSRVDATRISRPVREYDPHPSVPVSLTSFVGRHREVADLLDLIDRPDIRLLTLTGPGGVGKTRLALRVAREWADRTAGEIVFVSLASISDPAHFAPAVGNAFGLMDAPGQTLAERLATALGGNRTLLVLDNLEHLVDATFILTDLLAASPSLKILATSRTILRLSPEYEYGVQTLELPEPEAPIDVASKASAVQLFLDRAHMQSSSLREDQLESIVAICRRRDGLPLGIELAAAKSRLFTLSDLLARLDQRLSLLTGGPRDAPARLQTMRHAVAWSYDLLDGDNQRLFRSLSVFSGGFTLESAAAVSDRDSATGVIDGIGSLLDRSLIHRYDVDDGSARFTMLETMREFGREKLIDSGELLAIQERHATWFAGQVPAPDYEVWDDARVPPVTGLSDESENLRSALSWALEQGSTEQAIPLAVGLGPFWWQNGLYTEARKALDLILGATDPIDPAVRIFILGWAAEWAWLQSDYARAGELASEALRRCRTAGRRSGVAVNLFRLGKIGVIEDLAQAERHFQEAISIGRENSDPRTTFFSLIGVGFSFLSAGRIADARSCFAEARSLVHHFDEEMRDGPLLRVDHWEGRVAQEESNLDRARYLFEECLKRSVSVNNTFRQLLAAIVLGQISLDLGDVGGAALHSITALRLANRVGAPFRAGHCLGQLACVAVAAGDETRAAILLGAESALRQRFALGIGFDFYVPRAADLDLISGVLGEAAFSQAWERGRSLTMAQAVEEAMALIRIETPGPKGASQISSRETEVLALVAEGKSNREIADVLFLSHRTVEAHMASILAKLEVDSRHKAVIAARDLGLLETPP